MRSNHGINLAKPAWIVVCRHSLDFHLGQAASVKRQFERQAGDDWDFVCLTDRPSEDWHLPLRTDWPGWWSVLEAFRLTSQPHVLTVKMTPGCNCLTNFLTKSSALFVFHLDAL